jgi:hypothetical protein
MLENNKIDHLEGFDLNYNYNYFNDNLIKNIYNLFEKNIIKQSNKQIIGPIDAHINLFQVKP